MTEEGLNFEAFRWIIWTYNHMCMRNVPDVPTLLFECFEFTDEEVRRAIGLGRNEDLLPGLSSYLERNHGIPDLQ